MRSTSLLSLAAILLGAGGLSTPVAAHESRPIYIELTESAPQTYRLQWRTPPSVPPYDTPTVAPPRSCEAQTRLAEFAQPDGLVRRIIYHCSQGLSGQSLIITYPGPNPSVSSLVRYHALNGQRHIAVLGPQETTWVVPPAETATGVARQYTLLGIEHIWGGIDHLLFLVCLLWIAGTGRRILITVSGFTLAHSVTLVLSALNVVRLPVPPVEAAIALSIVFLATEVAKGPRQSLTWRYPIAVSSSFGLLHGFGFAAALGEIGLPQTELVTGLLFFNVGVEIGQIVFVTGVMGSMRGLRWLSSGWLRTPQLLTPARVTAGYVVGTLAACWLLQRSSAFWPG